MLFVHSEFNVREATESDCDRILTWRNSKSVRRWMSFSEEISLINHREWFNRRKETETSIFILEWNNDPVGVFTFKPSGSKKNQSLTMYVIERYQLFGLGMVLDWFMLETVFNKTKCDQAFGIMYPDNQVLTLHQYFGFEIQSHSDDFRKVRITRQVYYQETLHLKGKIFKSNLS